MTTIPGLETVETTTHTPMKVYCDATRRDNGEAACAWVLTDHNGHVLDIRSRHLGWDNTSMDAERDAIVKIVQVLCCYEVDHVIVKSDCQPAVKEDEEWLHGRYGNNFESLTIEWVSRDDNIMADGYADMEIHNRDSVQATQPTYGTTD
jgi:ribonuclease HI